MIKKALPLVIILASAQLGGQDIAIEPVFFGVHQSAGGLWLGEAKPISFAGLGVRGEVVYGRWTLQADLINMRFFGLGGIPNRFSPEQGFSWQQQSSGTSEEFDTDYSRMKLTYEMGGLRAMAGKFSQNWGPGLHSLTISEKPPTYPQFGFEWQLTEKLYFSYFHGELFSGIIDTLRTPLDMERVGGQRIYLDRYIAAHRLEWSPVKRLTIGLMESVVYGARGIEIIYLMPFMSFWSAEHYLNDTDNVQMSADLTWWPSPSLKLYGVFMMDEWRPQDTFKEDNHNWFAWQGGLDWRSILLGEDRLLAEATWTDHRIIRHRFPVNDCYSHGYLTRSGYVSENGHRYNPGYPVGHWTGAHAQSLLMAYMLPRWGFRFMISYLVAKRGNLTWDMLVDQYESIPYERFSGSTETVRTFDVIAGRPVWKQLWLELGFSLIDWDNAGFNPAQPDAGEKANVNKTSFTVGLYYNFNFPGYLMTLLRAQ